MENLRSLLKLCGESNEVADVLPVYVFDIPTSDESFLLPLFKEFNDKRARMKVSK